MATDAFEPDWTQAPNDFVWHVYQPNERGVYFSNCPTLSLQRMEWCTAINGQGVRADTSTPPAFSLRGLDWRNSLRHRPESAV